MTTKAALKSALNPKAGPKPAQTIIISPDSTVVEQEQLSLVQHATQITVKDQGEHATALTMLKAIAVAERRVVDLFKDAKAAAHAAHKAITTAEKKLLDPLQQATKIVWAKCNTFGLEQQRIAAEAQRKAQEAARQAEEERQLLEAVEAEQSGDAAAAQEILEAEVVVPEVKVEAAVAHVEGISSRTNYNCEVIDKAELIRYVAANLDQWSSLLEPNETELNRLAKAMRDSFKIPGCKLKTDNVLNRRV